MTGRPQEGGGWVAGMDSDSDSDSDVDMTGRPQVGGGEGEEPNPPSPIPPETTLPPAGQAEEVESEKVNAPAGAEAVTANAENAIAPTAVAPPQTGSVPQTTAPTAPPTTVPAPAPSSTVTTVPVAAAATGSTPATPVRVEAVSPAAPPPVAAPATPSGPTSAPTLSPGLANVPTTQPVTAAAPAASSSVSPAVNTPASAPTQPPPSGSPNIRWFPPQGGPGGTQSPAPVGQARPPNSSRPSGNALMLPPVPKVEGPLPPPFLLIAFKGSETDKFLLPLGQNSYISRVGGDHVTEPAPVAPPPPPPVVPEAPPAPKPEDEPPVETQEVLPKGKKRTRASMAKPAPKPVKVEKEPMPPREPTPPPAKKDAFADLPVVPGMKPAPGTVLISTFAPEAPYVKPDWDALATRLPFNNPAFVEKMKAQTAENAKADETKASESTDEATGKKVKAKAEPVSPKRALRQRLAPEQKPEEVKDKREYVLNMAAENWLPEGPLEPVTLRLVGVDDRVWRRMKSVIDEVERTELEALVRREPALAPKVEAAEAAPAIPAAATPATPAVPDTPSASNAPAAPATPSAPATASVDPAAAAAPPATPAPAAVAQPVAAATTATETPAATPITPAPVAPPQSTPAQNAPSTPAPATAGPPATPAATVPAATTTPTPSAAPAPPTPSVPPKPETKALPPVVRETWLARKKTAFHSLLTRVGQRRFPRFRLETTISTLVDFTADKWAPRPYHMTTRPLYAREPSPEEDEEGTAEPQRRVELELSPSPDLEGHTKRRKKEVSDVTFEMPVSLDALDERVEAGAARGLKRPRGGRGRGVPIVRKFPRGTAGAQCEGCAKFGLKVWRRGPGGRGTRE